MVLAVMMGLHGRRNPPNRQRASVDGGRRRLVVMVAVVEGEPAAWVGKR